MKTNNSKLRNVLLVLATAACTLTGALANEDAILNSDPIDINGYVKEAPATDHELESIKNELQKQKNSIQVNKQKSRKYQELSRTTERLADVTEDYVIEKNEAQGTIERFNKKVDCLMRQDQSDPECDEYVKKKSDHVSIKQAAPAKVEAEVAAAPVSNTIKVLPYAGMTSISSENENLEANLATGLRVESDIMPRLSVGLGVSYASLKTTDFKNAYKGYHQETWDGRYSNAYAGGREVEYSNLGFELYSKYYITKTERFRPYIGGGLSYNRSSMNYLENTSQSYDYQNGMQQQVAKFGDEELISSHVKGQIVGGSEVIFTKNIGLNLELQYARGFGSNLTSESAMSGPDQRRLEELNNELIEANMFSVYAGMLVMF